MSAKRQQDRQKNEPQKNDSRKNESHKSGHPKDKFVEKSDIIGKPMDRMDGRAKVMGTARYSAEYPFENLAHAVLVGSTIANGQIIKFDTSAAEKVPGLLAIITYQGMPKLNPVPTGPADRAAEKRLPLQTPNIYYSNQYIAIVIANNLSQAQQAASLLKVSYNQQPPVMDMEQHLAQATKPKQVAGKSADNMRGDIDAGLAAGSVRIEETYYTPTEHHNPMEPHATTAVWEGDKLTVYDATQYTYGVRRILAATFGLPEDSVRVICHYEGGGFGCKGNTWAHVPLAAVAAKQVKRPVRLAITRDQMFANVGHRAETAQKLTLAANEQGKLTAIIHEGHTHTSIFDEYTEPFTKATHMMYACANLKASQRLVPLNVCTPTYMRAPGEASGMFALESGLDELAYKLNLDPIQLRLINHADVDPDNNLPWSTKSLKECFQIGAERFGWSKRQPRPQSMRNGHYLRGFGTASAVYPVNHFPSSARVRILADGSAIAESSTHELGTGTYTVLTQVAADTLALPMDKVQVKIGDTLLPKAFVSGGSSTVMSVASSIQSAGKQALAKLIELAQKNKNSPLFGASTEQIINKGGKLVLKDHNHKGESYQTILSRAGLSEVEATASMEFNDREKTHSSHSFGAHFVEVQVDPDFGEVRLKRYTGVFGFGRVLNSKTGRSQMIGGAIMGIGMALMEESVFDNQFGRILTSNLADYHVPVNADIPEMDIHIIDEFDPQASPIGAKGAGELGIVGIAAAIANAVFHATGVRVRDLPITPDKLVGKIGK